MYVLANDAMIAREMQKLKKKLLLFPVLVKFAGDLQKQHVWTYKSRKVGHGDIIFDIEVKVTYI